MTCRSLAFLLAVLMLLPGVSLGHTFVEVELTCPVDNTKFKVRQTMSMTTFGSLKDFQKVGAIGSLYADAHHACPTCHYAGDSDAFKQSPKPEISKRVLAELKTWNAGRKLEEFEECIAAARINGWMGEGGYRIGDAYLTASYILREDRARQTERVQAQRDAITYFTKSFEAKELQGDVRAPIGYLIGELHRRTANFDEAVRWYDRAMAEENRPEWFAELVKEQRAMALAKNDDNGI